MSLSRNRFYLVEQVTHYNMRTTSLWLGFMGSDPNSWNSSVHVPDWVLQCCHAFFQEYPSERYNWQMFVMESWLALSLKDRLLMGWCRQALGYAAAGKWLECCWICCCLMTFFAVFAWSINISKIYTIIGMITAEQTHHWSDSTMGKTAILTSFRNCSPQVGDWRLYCSGTCPWPLCRRSLRSSHSSGVYKSRIIYSWQVAGRLPYGDNIYQDDKTLH